MKTTEEMPAADPLEGFTPMAADDWPEYVEDHWPVGKLRSTAMMAYDRLAQEGEIRPQNVRRTGSGTVIVTYLAKIPDAWVHELLASTERTGMMARKEQT